MKFLSLKIGKVQKINSPTQNPITQDDKLDTLYLGYHRTGNMENAGQKRKEDKDCDKTT